MWLLVIISLWCSFNTIAWIKSNEPWNFRVHFFFIPYIFTNYNSFKEWCTLNWNRIHESLFTENFYQIQWIERYLLKELKNTCIINIDVRIKSEGIFIYLQTEKKLYDYYISILEIKLFEEFKKPIKIIND